MESIKIILMNLFLRQQQRNRHREQTYGHREKEKRVRCMERVTWKLILWCIKYIANGNLLSVSGNSNRGSVSK